MKSLLDPSFKYTSSANTDIRKTFARVRREQRARKAAQEKVAEQVRVTSIFKSQVPK